MGKSRGMSQKRFRRILNIFRPQDEKSRLEKSDVFCMAPWVHVHVLPHGKVFPCCASGHLHDSAIGDLKKEGETLETAWNSGAMRKLRKDMVSGRKNKLCERCHKYQDLGKESERKWFNDEFGRYYAQVERTLSDGSLPEFEPYYIDIRFSNTCNLKCRICLHELSSAWHSDSVKLGLISKDTPHKVFPTVQEEELWPQISPLLGKLDRIHFAGGEPLVMDEHYMVLEELIRTGKTKTTITYNTNFSRLAFKKHDVIELWKKFDNVYVFASLDGMGTRGDYMRKGQKWEIVEANRIRLMEECPHVNFFVDATVSLMNVMHVPDFYSNWLEKGFIEPNNMNLYLLFDPGHYSVKALPEKLKKEISQLYEDFEKNYLDKIKSDVTKTKKHFNSIVEFMNEENTKKLGTFQSMTKSLDEVRKESFTETFPELKELVRPLPVKEE